MAIVSGCAGAPRGKLIAGGIASTAGVVLVAHRAETTCTPAGTWCDAVIAEPMNMTANAFTTGLGIGLVALGATLFVMSASDDSPQPEAMPVSSRLPAPPLEMSRDRIENRLAMQASRAARTGNCPGAVTTAKALEKQDQALHAQLIATDDNLATCYAIQRASQRM